MKRWQYAGNDHGSHFRGNAQIYLNKYDSENQTWVPLSECPFSFWDLDGDGRTDVTLRVSAAPRGTLHSADTDYANNYDYMWSREATPTSKIGSLNMRLSFNIDGASRKDDLDKPHSNFSFTMVGDQPYSYPGMYDFNPRRRAPQTTVHMPWALRWEPAMNYGASSTGFTWDEARSNFRWEGQFWIYEREYLSNTGSPTERWNMRREFNPAPSQHPELYFSPADSRYHLKGAKEGWLEAGHLVSDGKDLEFRWWDSDGDGYLDTVEVYRGNEVIPARVAHFNPRARAATLDPKALASEYNTKVLPQSVAADERLIETLRTFVIDDGAAKYQQAADAADSMERKRYCLDIARELLYLRLRELVLAREKSSAYPSRSVNVARFRDPAPGDLTKGYTLGDSLQFWSDARELRKMDDDYAAGEFKAVADDLSALKIEERNSKDAR